MTKSILCKLGIHRWGRATFIDMSIHSNVLDWKQSCVRCGKRITWVQPKGIQTEYHPKGWAKRRSPIFWIVVISIIVYLILKFLKPTY